MSTAPTTPRATPFTPRADQKILARIERRVAEFEWPKVPAGAGWELGTDPATLQAVVEHWIKRFDWRAEEEKLNRLPNFLARVGGIDLHFIHLRAAANQDRPPILLLHGWPGSIFEYVEVASRLSEGPQARDVVVVSLPGVGWSGAPEKLMGPRAMAALMHQLLTEVLGYRRYYAHGADWGSIISAWLGFDHPDACTGVHMTMASPRFIAGAATAPEEQQWLAGFRERFEDDGAYFRLQTSRPLTAGYALSDNPVGLLAWMLEKFAAWGDPAAGDKRDLYQAPEKAALVIRNAMLYLATGSVATSMWIYRGLATEGPPGYPGGKRVEVPVAFAATRDPVFVPPPRSLLEKAYNVTRWTELPAGGHFPGYDVPQLLADDIAAFAGGT
ncbi:epoxide hydrolase family protein [Ramlibacter sp. Leaf400]|uniref:epoxide hydrolase family protein n=1 Tax=Ramlibacter sp. Leaf400 TaxID=1736365 RepID=UPI0012E3E1B5|nr:epoxide hydrolase family protein [Ramlibacter sp. Leaf400]